MLFVSSAFAQAVSSPSIAADNGLMGILPPIAGIFIVCYFLLIRPTTNRQKAMQKMLDSLARGEKVVLGGGIIGTVVKLEEEGTNTILVEIAPDVRVKVQKNMIAEVLEKTLPAGNQDKPSDGKNKNKS